MLPKLNNALAWPAVISSRCNESVIASGSSSNRIMFAIVLRSMGHDELARVVAVSHLLVGLLVARSISGVPGALLLASNACAMGSTYASAFTPLTADG